MQKGLCPVKSTCSTVRNTQTKYAGSKAFHQNNDGICHCYKPGANTNPRSSWSMNPSLSLSMPSEHAATRIVDPAIISVPRARTQWHTTRIRYTCSFHDIRCPRVSDSYVEQKLSWVDICVTFRYEKQQKHELIWITFHIEKEHKYPPKIGCLCGGGLFKI